MSASIELFLDLLGDMYYAEQQLLKELPKMARAALHDGLRRVFETNLAETNRHVRRLEQVFEFIGTRAKIKYCPAISGIIDEIEESISKEKITNIDMALVYGRQKAEQYEIGSYVILREWAKLLKQQDAARLIAEILKEEKANHAKLNRWSLDHCPPTVEPERVMEMAA